MQVRKLVDANSVDLGITINDSTINEAYNTLHLVSTELVFCVSKNHPLADRTSISFKELADTPLILFKPDSYQNIIIKRGFSEVGVEPQIRLYTSQLYTIKKFLGYGNVGAFMYRQLAEMDSGLVCIPLEHPIVQDIVLIWTKSGSLYSDAENFIRYCKQFQLSK